MLPERVQAPGEVLGTVLPEAAKRSGLSPECLICAGTTGEAPSTPCPNCQVEPVGCEGEGTQHVKQKGQRESLKQ